MRARTHASPGSSDDAVRVTCKTLYGILAAAYEAETVKRAVMHTNDPRDCNAPCTKEPLSAARTIREPRVAAARSLGSESDRLSQYRARPLHVRPMTLARSLR
jgi:hypothetical protein